MKPEGADQGKEEAPLDGSEQLRQAADREVSRNSEKLAAALVKKALKGDLASTKVLVALADGKKPIEAQKQCGPSLAEHWEQEPQWREGQGQSPAVTQGGGKAGIRH